MGGKEGPSEKRLTDAIRRAVERVYPGSWTFKVHGGGMGRSGVPDVLCCVQGRFVGIEVKRPGGKTSRLQERELAAIDAAGGLAIVARSVEEALSALEGAGLESGRRPSHHRSARGQRGGREAWGGDVPPEPPVAP